MKTKYEYVNTIHKSLKYLIENGNYLQKNFSHYNKYNKKCSILKSVNIGTKYSNPKIITKLQLLVIKCDWTEQLQLKIAYQTIFLTIYNI